ATTNRTTLTAVAQRLARGAVPDGGVRLIGVSLAGLGDEPPPALFDETGRPGEPAGERHAQPPAVDVRGTRDVGEVPDGGAPARDGADGVLAPPHPDGAQPTGSPGLARLERAWRAGDDVRHLEFGHGWVQGAGHGRVTVRFETRSTGPGRARTLAADDPALRPADPIASLI
ncbi:MAG TPA: hypothetical protein VFY38_09610, partial [Pseudonocardia sp.]|nr:hypothetical protein [Pseudonocardia sp.]